MSLQIDGANLLVRDTNLNEEVRFTATASAVNDITITNAATGNKPSISASGDDTNVSVSMKGKGTGIADIGDSNTASATAGAATCNSQKGTITSEALTTAAGSDYVLTLTNNKISATSLVFVSVDNGTNTTEGLAVNRVTPGSGSVVIRIRNTHASSALNGTIKINFFIQ